MATEGMITSLPFVKQEDNYNVSDFFSKERPTESKTYLEESLVWEVVDDFEWVEPEIINVKSAGHRKVTHPDTSTATKTKRLKDQSSGKDDMKVPKNVSKSVQLTDTASFDRSYRNQANQLTTTELPRMPLISQRPRSFTEPGLSSSLEDSDTTQGKLFRQNLGLIYRQKKEIRKLEYDNVASRQTLQEAHDLIGVLKEKIEKRNRYIRERNRKEGDIARVVEALRRERDEKLIEYKLIMKKMNEALAIKDKALENTEEERTQVEILYQKQLKENTDLMRKIEAREKQIKQLKEKTEKAKRWKDDVRS